MTLRIIADVYVSDSIPFIEGMNYPVMHEIFKRNLIIILVLRQMK